MMTKEKLRAAKAELKIRQRVYNAALRDLNRLMALIAKLEAKL